MGESAFTFSWEYRTRQAFCRGIVNKILKLRLDLPFETCENCLIERFCSFCVKFPSISQGKLQESLTKAVSLVAMVEYMSQTIDPQQLAVRYSPPQLALVYTRAGDTLVHQIPLSAEDLDEEAVSVVQRLRQRHPSYLDNIHSEQLIRLVEMVQLHQDSRAPLPYPQAGRFDSSEDEVGQIDFMAIEKDLDYQPEDDF